MTKKRHTLLVLVTVSLVVKAAVFAFVWSADPDRVVTGDSSTYENPARALVERGAFSRDSAAGAPPETLITPGYPTFIASLYALFGPRREAIIVAQILVGTASVALVYLLALELWSAPVALVAAGLMLSDPLSLIYTHLIFSETLFTFTLLVAAWRGTDLLQRGESGGSEAVGRRTRDAWMFGLAMAVTTLVRPITYYAFAPALAGIVVHGRRRRGWGTREAAVVCVLAAAPWLAFVEGWRLRNYLATGSPVVASIEGVNLLWYRGAGIVAARDGVSFEEARRRIAADLPDTTGWPRARIDALYAEQGLRLIWDHPSLFLQVQAYGLFKILAGPGRSDILNLFGGVPYEDSPPATVRLTSEDWRRWWSPARSLPLGLLAYAILFLLVLYAGLALALGAWIRRGRPVAAPHPLLWWFTVYLLVVAAGPEAYARFRVPVMPLFALYAADGWRGFLDRRRARGRSVGAVAVRS